LRVTVAQPNCLPEFAKQIKPEITIAFLTQILGQGQLSNCPGLDMDCAVCGPGVQ